MSFAVSVLWVGRVGRGGVVGGRGGAGGAGYLGGWLGRGQRVILQFNSFPRFVGLASTLGIANFKITYFNFQRKSPPVSTGILQNQMEKKIRPFTLREKSRDIGLRPPFLDFNKACFHCRSRAVTQLTFWPVLNIKHVHYP